MYNECEGSLGYNVKPLSQTREGGKGEGEQDREKRERGNEGTEERGRKKQRRGREERDGQEVAHLTITCGQFSEDSLTFFTEPGCSLFMSLKTKLQ